MLLFLGRVLNQKQFYFIGQLCIWMTWTILVNNEFCRTHQFIGLNELICLVGLVKSLSECGLWLRWFVTIAQLVSQSSSMNEKVWVRLMVIFIELNDV